MADKRIIELTEKATVDNSDYLIVDNSNGGTKKLQIATLLGSIDKLKKEVVQTLPTQDIDENTIYLVPKQTAGTQNVYNEYMYINNEWETIGNTEVDLTNYQTKTDNNLQTTSKQIVGAINEVKSALPDSQTIDRVTANKFDTAIDIQSATSLANAYKCPSDGYVFIEAYGGDSIAQCIITDENKVVQLTNCSRGGSYVAGRSTMYVKKGMYCYYLTSQFSQAKFIPLTN